MILQVELTSHCNFRCTFCPQSKHGDEVTPGGNRFDRMRGYISDELFDLFLQNAERHASRVVIGYFGEQMLHPRFAELMRRFPRERRYKLWIFSNWSVADKARQDALMGFDSVRISLDASDAKLFDKVRPSGIGYVDRYTRIQRNLSTWLARTRRPSTTLMYTESSINAGDRAAFLKAHLPRLRPTDTIITKRVISYGGVTKDPTMTPNRCRVPDEPRLTVAWDGRVSPCNLDVNMALSTGNLLTLRSIPDVTRTAQWKRTIAGMRARAGICANCHDANNHQHTMAHKGTDK